ncbi:MAG: hypothetical protein ACREOJ_20720 [Gemmatimonadaceae bacterium]
MRRATDHSLGERCARLGTLLVAMPAALAVGCAPGRSSRSRIEPAWCTRAVSDLRHTPGNRTDPWSVTMCPSSGPEALAEVWDRHEKRDAHARAMLIEATSALRDARLFERLVNVATTAGYGDTNRVAALVVLVRYEHPDYAPSVHDLMAVRTPPPFLSAPSIPRRLDGAPPMDGTFALPDSAGRTLGRTLYSLARREPDGPVRRAAQSLRATLAFDDPADTPLDSGVIALIAGCEQRVALESVADVDVPIRLRVVEAGYDRTAGVRAGSESHPARVNFWLPYGTVVAMYGDREVARLSERNVCPASTGAAQSPGTVR